MGSAVEAESRALFHNGQEAEPIFTTLHKMGHAQLTTPMKNDNSTSNGIANKIVRQKLSKAKDMRFYWIQDLIKQDHFSVFCKSGTSNLGYYFTKHYPLYHHREMSLIYLHTEARERF